MRASPGTVHPIGAGHLEARDQGVWEATCSLNDTAGVLYIDWERRNKG